MIVWLGGVIWSNYWSCIFVCWIFLNSEGVGGGYVFDIIRVCGVRNVFFLLINLIRSYIKNIIDEYFDMLVWV